MKKAICILVFIMFLISGCRQESAADDLGSFTTEKTFSYDGKYYAICETEDVDGVTFIKVAVYLSDGQPEASFRPARARDFWGICWEKDAYNIWIQSADTGVHCYAYQDGQWQLDSFAVRPDYVVSKYDDIK